MISNLLKTENDNWTAIKEKYQCLYNAAFERYSNFKPLIEYLESEEKRSKIDRQFGARSISNDFNLLTFDYNNF